MLTKQLNNSKLELKATQDDLSKAKASLDTSRSEVETLIKQLEEAKAALGTSSAVNPEQAEEISRLTQELAYAKDDHAALTEALNLTKSSMTEMSDRHALDLEEAAKTRASEGTHLKTIHEGEVNTLIKEKTDFAVKLSDIEGELATVRAELDSLKASPKVNGNGSVTADGASPSGGTGVVTDEMMRQLHEAHNLKMGDLGAEHEKAMKAAQQQLEDAQKKIGELGSEVSRKAMEIQFMESEQEDQNESVTRYVKNFRFKTCVGILLALVLIYGLL
jgi:DNA repair exonuclease SbcCD ATPase subunit